MKKRAGKRDSGRPRRREKTRGVQNDKPKDPRFAWRPPQKPGPKAKRKTRNEKRESSLAPGLPQLLIPRHSPKFEKYSEAARLLYVEQGCSLRQIRIKGGIPVADTTLENWCRRGGWSLQRQKLHRGPQGQASDVELLLAGLVADLKEHFRKTRKVPRGAFDDLLKGTKALESLRGDSYFNGHLVTVLSMLSDFLELSGFAELRKEFAKLLPRFTIWAMQKKAR